MTAKKHSMRMHLHAFAAFLVSLFSSSLVIAQELQALDYETGTIQISLSDEPPNLNSMKSTDMISGFVLEHIQEGLLRKNAQNQLAPGIAERWELTDTTATFWLREEAIWSDGIPITAHDFVFTWRKILDPQTASEYAAILYPIKNAEAVNNGQLSPEELGVRALDDHILEVDLEQPTGYFMLLMPFTTFYPVREDFFAAQNGRYAADAGNMVFSGPYLLTEWVHGASLRMEKNPRYWNSDIVQINTINVPYITPDNTAVFNLFKDGKLAIEGGQIGLTAESLDSAIESRMRIRSFPDGSVFYQEFNHREGRIGGNLNFRKALQAAYDSQEFVYKVLGIPGYVPGESLFPTWLEGVNDKFRVEYPGEQPPVNFDKAREYLKLARQELGLETFPVLTMLASETPTAQIQSQYLQSLYKNVLGLDFVIDAQTFKLRLAKMLSGEFDIVLAGWGPDYEDPMTFADLFATWNASNRGRYSNPELDRQVRLAQGTTDQQTRMDAMGQIQRILIDQAVILPDYERVLGYVQHPQLDGIMMKVTGGTPVFTYARVLPPAQEGTQ